MATQHTAEFGLGEVVWAKADGYNWWPARISPNPLPSLNGKYHLQYFGLKCFSLLEADKIAKYAQKYQTFAYQKSMSQRLRVSIEAADNFLKRQQVIDLTLQQSDDEAKGPHREPEQENTFFKQASSIEDSEAIEDQPVLEDQGKSAHQSVDAPTVKKHRDCPKIRAKISRKAIHQEKTNRQVAEVLAASQCNEFSLSEGRNGTIRLIRNKLMQHVLQLLKVENPTPQFKEANSQASGLPVWHQWSGNNEDGNHMVEESESVSGRVLTRKLYHILVIVKKMIPVRARQLSEVLVCRLLSKLDTRAGLLERYNELLHSICVLCNYMQATTERELEDEESWSKLC